MSNQQCAEATAIGICARSDIGLLAVLSLANAGSVAVPMGRPMKYPLRDVGAT
jgi:hypothetical protein